MLTDIPETTWRQGRNVIAAFGGAVSHSTLLTPCIQGLALEVASVHDLKVFICTRTGSQAPP